MADNETSFCELRKKEIINTADGSKLGHIVDLVISVSNGTALGMIAPYKKTGFFSKPQNLFIPLSCITTIGADVILINVTTDADGNLCCKTNSPASDSSSCENCNGQCATCKLYQ